MKMLEKKAWKEFKDSGLLWLVNMNLHLFGWALVLHVDGDDIVNAYPSRTKFRGFSEDCNTKGYEKVTKYLNDNSDELLKETQE